MLIALLGAAIYLVTLRPLIGRDPLTTILATFGISLVLQNYALWQFGPVSRKIAEPIGGHFTLFYLDYPWYRVAIALLSAAIIGGFWLFLKFGIWGIWIRATTQDRVMAQAMGIPVPWVLTGVFAIGSGMAAASGVLFGPFGGVDPTMGINWILRAFIVVVVGGMGSLGGSIAAAILISLLEAYASLMGQPVAGGHRLVRRADRDPAVPTDRPIRRDAEMRRGHGVVFWTGFAVVIALLVVGAACPARVLAPLSDRDPDLGFVGDVVRHPDRLHRHGIVRSFGVFRARHVWRGRRAVDLAPA